MVNRKDKKINRTTGYVCICPNSSASPTVRQKIRAAGRSVPRPEVCVEIRFFTMLLPAFAAACHILPLVLRSELGYACGCGTFTALARIGYSRREKLVYGEIHLVEQTARIFLTRSPALFFGNAEIVGRNEDLNFAHQANDREQSERNVNAVSRGIVAETFFKTSADA